MKVPTRWVGVAVLGCLLTGCHRAEMPYLGHWDGGLDVTGYAKPAKGGDARVPDVKRVTPNGYLQMYQTGGKYLIELSNAYQTIDINGTWSMKSPKRVELTPNKVEINEPKLDEMQAMRRPFIDPDALRIAYGKPMILDLSPDGKRLTGLLIHVGPLEGNHAFLKAGR